MFQFKKSILKSMLSVLETTAREFKNHGIK